MQRRIFDNEEIPQGWQPSHEGIEHKGIAKPPSTTAEKPPPPPPLSPRPKTSK